MLHFVVETSEGFRTTIAEHPGHSSPCATVNRLDDPKLVFLLPIKCHISSNSISLISPEISWSGRSAPASAIQRYTKEGQVSKMCANMLNEALKRLFSGTIEQMLESEMDEHLGSAGLPPAWTSTSAPLCKRRRYTLAFVLYPRQLPACH